MWEDTSGSSSGPVSDSEFYMISTQQNYKYTLTYLHKFFWLPVFMLLLHCNSLTLFTSIVNISLYLKLTGDEWDQPLNVVQCKQNWPL